MDWDDIRHFLAVAQGGSVRAAAAALGVNHATVLRRVAQLEARLGAQLFEKLPSGYRLTTAGEEILDLAARMQESSLALESRVLGRDQGLRGRVRVTLPPPLAAHLLMPDFADFAQSHPEIELDLVSSGALANLTNREADLAIRVVYDRDSLPQNLHGRKGPELWGATYAARAGHEAGRWIVVGGSSVPDWVRALEAGGTRPPLNVTDFDAQLAAVRQGMGATVLPCFAGDADPALVRVAVLEPQPYGRLWLLTQGEMRKTRRVRLLAEFIAGRLSTHGPRLAGQATAAG